MEEQTTWKGHSFTLLVFTGIVVLCSIFFILGMLAGRAEGQKLNASVSGGAASKSEAKAAAPKDDKPDFTFYESVKKEEPSASQRAAPAKPDPEPLAAAPPKKTSPAPEPSSAPAAPEKLVNYQIGAVRKPVDAEKLLNDVKKRGFRAFILAPPAGEANPYFRVQVGPFADLLEAQEVKKKLEGAGYQPILKK